MSKIGEAPINNDAVALWAIFRDQSENQWKKNGNSICRKKTKGLCVNKAISLWKDCGNFCSKLSQFGLARIFASSRKPLNIQLVMGEKLTDPNTFPQFNSDSVLAYGVAIGYSSPNKPRLVRHKFGPVARQKYQRMTADSKSEVLGGVEGAGLPVKQNSSTEPLPFSNRRSNQTDDYCWGGDDWEVSCLLNTCL